MYCIGFLVIISFTLTQPARHLMLNQRLIEHWHTLGHQSTLASYPDDSFIGANAEWADRVDLDSPDTVFSFLMNSLPESNSVYPTERYFYYMFTHGGRVLAGNIRFSDIERGVVHIAYYDINDQEFLRSKSYSSEAGIEIRYAHSEGKATISMGDCTRYFGLNTADLDHSDKLELDAQEEYVSGILDESGYRFHLVYNRKLKYFYFILNEQSVPEELSSVKTRGGHTLWIGSRTRFVFFDDVKAGRKVLVGVRDENIKCNNYYDGPFDQVPPNLMIKDRLESAYPYVVYRGGIDDHGNFVDASDQRVAIAPYMKYGTVSDLMGDTDALYRDGQLGVAAWIHMCYEWKRDFHKTLNGDGLAGGVGQLRVHDIDISASWPSNHWADSSKAWPSDHGFSLSHEWGANFSIED